MRPRRPADITELAPGLTRTQSEFLLARLLAQETIVRFVLADIDGRRRPGSYAASGDAIAVAEELGCDVVRVTYTRTNENIVWRPRRVDQQVAHERRQAWLDRKR